MSRYHQNHTIVLAGYGFDEQGPYVMLNDIESEAQSRYSLFNKTISMVRSDRRFCVGRFDLQTYERSVCPLRIEFLPSEKDDMCPACKEATGFNPSFYYAETISPQQREYNQMPHYVYMAYFSPEHIKAGISSETRGIERLLEQGARSACIVGRFPDADAARKLEAALCAQSGIAETMRSSLKARLLTEVSYDPAQAREVLIREMDRMHAVDEVRAKGFASEEVQDLSPFYFGSSCLYGASPDVAQMHIPENSEDQCAGECVGMVGDLLILRQEESFYVVSLKEWESHVIDLYEDEIRTVYHSAPEQFSLF